MKWSVYIPALFLGLILHSNELIAHEINCSRFYNPIDVTDSLQAAILSGAEKIIIPYMGQGTKWISGPLKLRSNIEIVLEAGVVLQSKSGAFPFVHQAFITIKDVDDIKIIGYGAKLEMLLSEYHSGEWRHGINIIGSSDVTIEGLSIEKCGGDGIYLGRSNTNKYSKKINIYNVKCFGNARTGIALTSAKDVQINNCYISYSGKFNDEGVWQSNTDTFPGPAAHGTWTGINIEPNDYYDIIQNINIRDCIFENNRQGSILFVLMNLNDLSSDISVNINNNMLEGNYTTGIALNDLHGGLISGFIDIENNIFEYPGTYGIDSRNWGITNIKVKIEDNYIYDFGSFFTNAFTGQGDGVGGTDADSSFTGWNTVINSGDFNGDSKTDLFFKGYKLSRGLYLSNEIGNGFTRAFIGQEDNLGGTDSEPFFTDSVAKIYTGDFNGDMKTDLFVKGYGQYRGLYHANEAGDGFIKAFMGEEDSIGGTDTEPFFTSSEVKIYTGDYNGDLKADLFFKGYGQYRGLYLANDVGDGFIKAFIGEEDCIGGTDSEPFFTSSEAKIYTGDYNADGKTDLFIQGYGLYRGLYLANNLGNGFIRVFMGEEDGVGGTDSEPFFTDTDAQIFTGDYNGDGKTDLFIKGFKLYRALYLANKSGNGFVRVFMGQEDGIGGTDSEPFFTSPSARIHTGDFDGDGRTDLFVKGYQKFRALYLARKSGDGFIRVFMGQEDGVGGTDSELFFTHPDARILTGDYNGDGKTDLFIKGFELYRALYLSQENILKPFDNSSINLPFISDSLSTNDLDYRTKSLQELFEIITENNLRSYLFDINGRLIRHINNNSFHNPINFPVGLYVLVAYDQNQRIIIRKKLMIY